MQQKPTGSIGTNPPLGPAIRGLGVFIAGAAFAASSLAAPRVTAVTVQQLAQMLSKARGGRDARVARQLSALKLTERASAARLAQWDSEFPGKRTQQALAELTDASAFLDLPAAEIPDKATPDAASLRQILVRAVDYVKKTIPRLPDFYAQRTITSFEDSGASKADRQCGLPGLLLPCNTQGGSNSSDETPLRVSGQASAIVTYVDGRELVNGNSADSLSLSLRGQGLATVGEFGPILAVTLGDALHGRIFWGHWEQGASGLLAVLRYTVAAKDSHYMVEIPSLSSDGSTLPAYHGELAIDPDSGVIYRITMIADPDQPEHSLLADLMVEYGTVAIGGMPYICPVRGVALFRMAAPSGMAGAQSGQPPLVTRLNDIAFTGYHLFRAEMKILPDGGARPPDGTAPPAAPAH